MSSGDDLDRLRDMRPDRGPSTQPHDPAVLRREKERLMAMIEQSEELPTWGPMPDVYPRLAYRDERAAIEYLTRVFGFTERRESRMGSWDDPEEHLLAWLEFGDGVVMVGYENADVHRIMSPIETGASVIMHVHVHDIDAHYARAVAEGANVTMELEDAFYGSRRYEATDLEGHRWHFDEPHHEIRARGGSAPD